MPSAWLRAASGFAPPRGSSPLAHGTWIRRSDGLAADLSTASVAIVAGGVTLYEACAIGVPAVAVAVTGAQAMTVRAMAAHGAVVDAGRLDAGGRGIEHAAEAACRLLRDRDASARLTQAGRHLVDGRGAFRVADALRELARDGVSHAA
jgi:spore coat polysaccharide biosynthesis predicted glycosyltransferase SpsG